MFIPSADKGQHACQRLKSTLAAPPPYGWGVSFVGITPPAAEDALKNRADLCLLRVKRRALQCWFPQKDDMRCGSW